MVSLACYGLRVTDVSREKRPKTLFKRHAISIAR